MGRVLVEALAAKKAVIGANIEGIPNVISDGVDGLLFEVGNSDDLAKKMETLIVNSKLRDNMGRQGMVKATKQYSGRAYYKNLVQFYSEVIN